MKRSHSFYALGALAVVTLVTLQSDALRAQLSGFDWQTANCDEKIQEFNSIERKGTVDKLTWVYNGVLDDIFGQTCTIMGNVQGVGYISDPDVLIDPNNMEGLYFSAEGNFYFVTYTANKTVAYAFTLEEGVEPYAYLSEKGPDLLKMVGNARRLHLGMETTDPEPMEEEIAMEEEPVEQMEEEDTQPATEESAELVLYRDGKVVNQEEENEAFQEEELTNEEEELEDDPVLQQLLKEQEEFFEETEATEEGEESTEGESPEEEVVEESPEEEVAAPAPAPAAGLGLTTILSGGAAVILGIGATLFILFKKKKKVVPTEDAPPPTPETASGTPQQKSDRLEKALAAMDEETEG